MFFRTGVELSRINFPKSDATAVTYKNALVESFAIHLRNLLLFLYGDGKKNDIHSDDFFLDPINDWRKARPREGKFLKDARERASREISHLTVLRQNPSNLWPVSQLMNEIQCVLRTFVERASPTKLDPSVKAL